MQKSFLTCVLLCLLVKTEGIPQFDKRDPGAGTRLPARASGKKHLEVRILPGAYYAFEPEGAGRDSAGYFLTRALNESSILKEDRLGRQALCLPRKGEINALITLNSLSAFIDNETALTAIQDSQYRAHAMSLIHQKLYNPENVASIENVFYVRELTSDVRDGYNTGQRIRFEYDIDPLEQDVSQTSSLEMKPMAGLSADPEGKFLIENSSGTTIKISFIPDLCIKRSGSLAATFVSTN